MNQSVSIFFKRYIYVLLGVAALVIVHFGFAQTYISPVLSGSFTGRKILHVHGAVFMTWVVLCILQPFLIQKKRIQLHKKIGVYGAVLAGIVTLMGLYIGVSGAHVHMARDGEQAVKAFLLIPITDMILFFTLCYSGHSPSEKPGVAQTIYYPCHPFTPAGCNR